MKGIRAIERAQKRKADSRFYHLNSILGNDWAIFYIICGGRMTGKSYSVTDFLCRRKKTLGEQCKNYWLRISDTSTKALLVNKADKLVDPDLKRKYQLDLTTKAFEVFDHKKLFCTVLPLSSFGKMKGQAFFDKDYTGEYNIVLDEFQLEQGEKRTSFDILYNFAGMCENIARTTKTKIRVFLLGNTLEEAAPILKAFNFIPEKFGRFYLKSKRCVIDNLEPTEEYLKDRKGSIADILSGDSSNYTNIIEKDRKLLTNERLRRPTAVIRFGKEKSRWYTLWDGHIIRKFKGERVAEPYHIAMLPYLGTFYMKEKRELVIERYNLRGYQFTELISQAYFQDELARIKKS